MHCEIQQESLSNPLEWIYLSFTKVAYFMKGCIKTLKRLACD